MSGYAKGGDDVITISGLATEPVTVYRDALTMSDDGGNNVLQTDGAYSSNTLYGDAYSVSGDAVGGNNTLIGGVNGSDTLIGDAYQMEGSAKGGNNVLVSGHGNDSMWGNAVVMGPNVTPGQDTFVFAPSNGNDTINDFHSGLDHIDLNADAAIGVHSFANLSIQVVGKQQCHSIRRERLHHGGWQYPSTRCRFSIGLTTPSRKHCACSSTQTLADNPAAFFGSVPTICSFLSAERPSDSQMN